ncbi:MAG: 50S ribosomal protein L11 methyltransferase, partial [Syntrophomonadaceae bacterium]|nr:50S ribosomal protein L11 methyltransferase [Syntrophomonadaceae bacterium]
MKWTEIRVTTSPEAGDAVAGLFHRLGCAGVAVDDPAWVLEHIRRGDWDAWELEAEALRPGQVTVTGYVAHGGSDASAWLQQELRRSGVDFRLQVRVVDEESWAEAWKRYYHAVPVGRRLLVRPSLPWSETSRSQLGLT